MYLTLRLIAERRRRSRRFTSPSLSLFVSLSLSHPIHIYYTSNRYPKNSSTQLPHFKYIPLLISLTRSYTFIFYIEVERILKGLREAHSATFNHTMQGLLSSGLSDNYYFPHSVIILHHVRDFYIYTHIHLYMYIHTKIHVYLQT